MPDQRPKTSTRDVVKEVLTPQRVSVLTWAFAAVLFGSVGLASLQFARDPQQVRLSAASGQLLPPTGDVIDTGSITTNNSSPNIQVMPSENGRMITGTRQEELVQIEDLQRELVVLRRRISALSEQNRTYSRRIAALEKQRSAKKSPKDGSRTPKTAEVQPSPEPGKIRSAAPASAAKGKAPKTDKPKATANSKAPVPAKPPAQKKMARDDDKAIQKRIEAVPAPETLSGDRAKVRKQLYNSGQAALAAARTVKAPAGDYEPVRIVKVPPAKTTETDDKLLTGSINPAPEPKAEAVLPKIIMPSDQVGRTRGAGKSSIRQSDFGVVVGTYGSVEEASKAWTNFKDQNEDKMRDLRPLVAKSEMKSGSFELIAGPFGNAADAAVACLRLLDITEGICRPAFFVGDTLPETAISRR